MHYIPLNILSECVTTSMIANLCLTFCNAALHRLKRDVSEDSQNILAKHIF